MDANLLKGNLDLILLSILEEGPMYGLEITKEAQARTDGYFKLNVGSLYPALHRLERGGLLAVTVRSLPRGGAPVRYYELTDTGRRALADRREAYRRFDGAVRALWGRR